MAYRTILQSSGREGEPLPKEAYSDATIRPGDLLERTATGVKKHATAGGVAQLLVAKEDAEQGNEVTDNYTVGNRCFFYALAPGDQAAMYLAQGETIAIGDFLESNGDGGLRKSSEEASELPHNILAVALEAKDLSTSSESDTLILVECA